MHYVTWETIILQQMFIKWPVLLVYIVFQIFYVLTDSLLDHAAVNQAYLTDCLAIKQFLRLKELIFHLRFELEWPVATREQKLKILEHHWFHAHHFG